MAKKMIWKKRIHQKKYRPENRLKYPAGVVAPSINHKGHVGDEAYISNPRINNTEKASKSRPMMSAALCFR